MMDTELRHKLDAIAEAVTKGHSEITEQFVDLTAWRVHTDAVVEQHSKDQAMLTSRVVTVETCVGSLDRDRTRMQTVVRVVVWIGGALITLAGIGLAIWEVAK